MYSGKMCLHSLPGQKATRLEKNVLNEISRKAISTELLDWRFATRASQVLHLSTVPWGGLNGLILKPEHGLSPTLFLNPDLGPNAKFTSEPRQWQF